MASIWLLIGGTNPCALGQYLLLVTILPQDTAHYHRLPFVSCRDYASFVLYRLCGPCRRIVLQGGR